MQNAKMQNSSLMNGEKAGREKDFWGKDGEHKSKIVISGKVVKAK